MHTYFITLDEKWAGTLLAGELHHYLVRAISPEQAVEKLQSTRIFSRPIAELVVEVKQIRYANDVAFLNSEGYDNA